MRQIKLTNLFAILGILLVFCSLEKSALAAEVSAAPAEATSVKVKSDSEILAMKLAAQVKPFPVSTPTVEATVPTTLNLPKDFKPPKKGKKAYLGFRRSFGIVLPKQSNTYPICVVETKKGAIPNDILSVGDVIVGINGKPCGKDPARQLRTALDTGKKTTGTLWVSRWRKGEITLCLINLGTLALDLTRGGTADSSRDWRLGPLGANGWVFSKRSRKGASSRARQILITAVDADGPAHEKLLVDDVVIGVNGKPISYDARKVLAEGINEAEKAENQGKLTLRIWRAGNELEVTVTLPVMGSYSPTMPYNCSKTDTIIDNGVKHMMANKDTLLKPGGWISYINGLGLLATGREDVIPLVKELAHGSLLKEGETLSVDKHVSMMCWWWSYKTIFLCEYYLRTKDAAVLPTIEEHATKISMGQSGAGTWGHTYAARANTGYLHGHLGGYGAINQQGLTLMIALPLVEKCGITNKEIKDAIKRGDDFFSYFIGKGTIPYGDHGAANEWFDDNGKSGSAAIFFDLMDNQKGREFFSAMVVGSAPNGREEGHTGHFWSRLWGGVGAARGGTRVTQAFFKEINPLYTLERQADGRFVFQDNAGEAGPQGDPKKKWDSTGARLLSFCVPRRAIYISGKETPQDSTVSHERIEDILAGGRLDGNVDARATLTVDQIIELLKDPLPPIRSIGARTLAEREINCVDRLIPLLESDNNYARYGAAEALSKAGFGNKAAADKLISMMATDTDVTFKTYAISALINRDKKKGLLSVAKPAIPVLLKMAVKHSPDDPRRVLQHDIGRALFYNGNAQPRRGLLPEYGLDGVDRSLLIPAVREILTNKNGGARSTVGWVYPKLTAEERTELWGDIYQASREIAPSGIMFASGIRTQGLELMAKHHIKEGLDLAVWYIRYQKGHGGPGRIPNALDAILKYGSYAKQFIPELEKHLTFWENRRNKRKPPTPKDPDAMIRAAIEKIKAMPDQPDFELVSIADTLKKLGLEYPPQPIVIK